MAAKPLTPEQQEDARRLKGIFEARKNALHLTQETLAEQLGFANQSAVSQYLNARIPLNAPAAAKFATALRCRIGEFSPSIQSEIDELAKFANGATAPARADPELFWPFTLPIATYRRLSEEQQTRLDGLVLGFVAALEEASPPARKRSQR